MARALVLAVALLASSCTYWVVGDSTMWQIEEVNGGHGSTMPACGFVYNPWCVINSPSGVIPLDPPTESPVIIGVSVNDRNATDLSGYSDAHAYYQAHGVPVVWVEVPPGPLLADPSAFNAAVAAELGCELVPFSVREAEFYDGTHYTNAGALTVAGRFETLTAADAC